MIISKYKLLISMSILPFLISSAMAVTKGEKKFIEEQITKSIQLDVIAMRDKELISKNDLEDLGNIKPEKQADALVDLISDAIASGEIIKAPPPKPKIVEAPVKKVISSKEPERVVRHYISSDEPEPRQIIIQREDPTAGIIREFGHIAKSMIRDNDNDDRDSRRRDRWKDYDRRSDKTIIIQDSKKDDSPGDKKKDLKTEKVMKAGDEKDVKKPEDLAKDKVVVKDEKKVDALTPEKKIVDEPAKLADDNAPAKLDKDEPKTKIVDDKAKVDKSAETPKAVVDDPLKSKVDEVKDAAKDAVEKVADAAAKKTEVLIPPKNGKIGE